MILMQIRITGHGVEKDDGVEIRQLSTDESQKYVGVHDVQRKRESRFAVPHKVESHMQL